MVALARPDAGEGAVASDERWRSSLADLCGAYHDAIVSWFAAVGAPGDPRDLAHDFLHRWLRGNPLANYDAGQRRFRHFLKASLRHFLIESIRKAKAVKRGGEVEHVDVADAAVPASEPDASELADRFIARQLALQVLRRIDDGWHLAPGQLRIALLHRTLGRPTLDDPDMAAGFGISVNALRLRITRLRQQFWTDAFREVRAQCGGAVAAEDEFASLVQAMQRDPELIDALDASLGARPSG